jgi:hypothetical protein
MSIPTDPRFVCRPCARAVTPLPRPRGTGIALVAVVALVLAMIGFSALIGPFIMFTLPLILVAGFAIGPLVGLLSAPHLCPHCRREVALRPALGLDRSERTVRGSFASPPGGRGDMKTA